MTDRPEPTPDPQRPGAATTVTMMDAFGRPTQLPRAQWRKEVLPKMVDAYAHAPDKLAAMIVQHLREGLGEDLLPAALRLAAVDQEPERGLAVLAAVQRATGDLDGAESTLKELQQRRPQSSQARVGLAMVRDARGDRDGAVALVWEALQQDGNHADALHSWLQWQHQGRGEDGYPAALEEVCALPGSWRPQLWRARWRLERGDFDGAANDHRDVLARAAQQPDVLVTVAQDLARARQHELIEELVLPRYQLEQHHPAVGLAILQYHAGKQQPDEGMELLHRLRVRFQRALDQQLAPFDAAFTRMRVPAAPPQPVGTPRITLYRLDRPVWFAPLGRPEFALPRKRDGVRPVMVAALAVRQQTVTAQLMREDELGRLSRSLPLFLQDHLQLSGGLAVAAALPMAEAGGWVVSGTPWPEERIVELLTDRERGDTLVVTGQVEASGRDRKVDLWVFDAAAGRRVATVSATGEEGKLGPVLLQLLADLGPALGGEPVRPTFGSEVFWDHYAAGLAQLAALVTASQGALPKDRVYGHRAILEWLLAVALEERRSVQARLCLAAGLCADAAIGSRVHLELAAPFAELFRVEPKDSAFAQLAQPALRVLGLDSLWQHRRAEILAAAGDGARAFLQRREAAAGGGG
ncbi:MAG: hypothetical protein AB7O97_15465 [Planctomycetota bacterium]